MKKNEEIKVSRLSRTEAFEIRNRERLDSFLDRNGYTVREVRGIVRAAITLWETQEGTKP